MGRSMGTPTPGSLHVNELGRAPLLSQSAPLLSRSASTTSQGRVVENRPRLQKYLAVTGGSDRLESDGEGPSGPSSTATVTGALAGSMMYWGLELMGGRWGSLYILNPMVRMTYISNR